MSFLCTRHARTKFLLPLMAALSFFGGPPAQAAENFPEREIRIDIGFPPGSSTELSLRALVDVAQKYSPKPLIIVNKPGAAQSIAFSDLVSSKPDGYTIGVGTDSFRALTRHQLKLSFNPDNAKALLGYARFRHVLFVKGDSPYNTIEDLLAAGRANAQKIDYGGTGEGTAPDLFGRILFGGANVPVTYIPFKGTNELIPAVMGRHVISGINDVSILMAFFKRGELKPLLVFGDERIAELPDVPTTKEKGLGKDSNLMSLLNSSICVFVPRDLPADRFKVLYDIFSKAAKDPDFKRQADVLGLQQRFLEPEAVEKQISETSAAGTPLLKQLNLYLQ